MDSSDALSRSRYRERRLNNDCKTYHPRHITSTQSPGQFPSPNRTFPRC